MTLPKHLQEEFEKEFPNNVHELKGKNGIPSGSVNVNKELLAFLSHVWEEGYREGFHSRAVTSEGETYEEVMERIKHLQE